MIAEDFVDEYLSEKEQIEAIRRWWRENGWYLVGGVAIATLAYVGYGQYQDYRDRRNEEAASFSPSFAPSIRRALTRTRRVCCLRESISSPIRRVPKASFAAS